jgi:hypothetical protein
VQPASPSGDNREWVKIHGKSVNIFSRTSRLISKKFDTNHPLRKEISNEPSPVMITKVRWSFKTLLKNHKSRKAQIYMKAC